MPFVDASEGAAEFLRMNLALRRALISPAAPIEAHIQCEGGRNSQARELKSRWAAKRRKWRMSRAGEQLSRCGTAGVRKPYVSCRVASRRVAVAGDILLFGGDQVD